MRRAFVLLVATAIATPGKPPAAARARACGDGALTPPGTQHVRRLPFLQQVGPTSVIVAWASEPAHPVDVVATDLDGREVARARGGYVGSPGLLREREQEWEEEAAEAAEGDEEPEPSDADDWFPMAARLEGLEPAQVYCYRLEDATGRLTSGAPLRTAPSPGRGAEVRFVAFGDSGSGSAAQQAVARRIGEVPVDLILHLGDLAYRRGTHEQLQDHFFQVYAPYLTRAPVYPAAGNHDVMSARGEPFRDAFVLPGDESWYSFDWGDVHFVALDTTRIGAEQEAWLERDLTATRQPWIIVFGHHPPFSSSNRGPSRAFRERFVPILERHRVDLVLSGHEHHYERTRPIAGVVYVVSGGGGAPLSDIGWSYFTQRAARAHHFLDVRVTPGMIVVRAVDAGGGEIDQFEIRRQSAL